jgi:hypothetical protein
MNIEEYVKLNLDNDFSTPITTLNNIDLNEQLSEMMTNNKNDNDNDNITNKIDIIYNDIQDLKKDIKNIQVNNEQNKVCNIGTIKDKNNKNNNILFELIIIYILFGIFGSNRLDSILVSYIPLIGRYGLIFFLLKSVLMIAIYYGLKRCCFLS